MKYKPGQLISIYTKDGRKYLARVKKARFDYPSLICHSCYFYQARIIVPQTEIITERCALSANDIAKCIARIPPFCYLQLIRECKTL